MRAHPTFDDYWRAWDANARAEQVTVPAVFVGGWYDIFQQGTIDAFAARQERGGEGARGRTKLIMGPWTHGVGRSQAGELSYPDNAARAPGVLNEANWLLHWLKGVDNAVEQAPAVTYYTMGAAGEPGAPGNEWRQVERWPVPATATTYYLQPDGTLATDVPPNTGQPREYAYDPANPVPTRGGNNLTIPAGPMDQRPVEGRADVLVFTTEPLAAPIEVTGPLTARLWVSSSAPDTDFTVKLTDVYPDGRSMLVADGVRRMRFRNGFERAEPMTAGQVYPVTITFGSTSLVFNKGHRVRVAISSSNAPRFEPNANTGAPWSAGQATQVARNTVYVDRDRPSQVVLPVVGAR
jgi:putative CocE/NonD family hydrolase